MPTQYQPIGHRTFLENAVDLTLAENLDTTRMVVRVHSVDDLVEHRVPFYAVIDPFNDSGREYVEVESFDAATKLLTFARRDMAGTDGVSHRSGVIMRITFMAQHLDDMWEAIDVAKQTPGPEGPVGVTGAPGTPGSDGAASTVPGPPGDRLILGTGAPTLLNTVGSHPGDEYIDMTTGDLYTLS